MPVLKLYIPVSDYLNTIIKAGSAIVGSDVADSTKIKIYYEGNVFGAENLFLFKEKALIAAGRLVAKYPTTAFAVADKNDLLAIGTFNTDTKELKIQTQEASAFKSWVFCDDRYSEREWDSEFGEIAGTDTDEVAINQYLASGGCACFKCQSDDIEGGAFTTESGVASQAVWCNSCDHEWRDTYTLTAVT